MQMAQNILRRFYVPPTMKFGFFYSFNVELRRLRGFSRKVRVDRRVSEVIGLRPQDVWKKHAASMPLM